jgi:hypothetical protein
MSFRLDRTWASVGLQLYLRGREIVEVIEGSMEEEGEEMKDAFVTALKTDALTLAPNAEHTKDRRSARGNPETPPLYETGEFAESFYIQRYGNQYGRGFALIPNNEMHTPRDTKEAITNAEIAWNQESARGFMHKFYEDYKEKFGEHVTLKLRTNTNYARRNGLDEGEE